MKGKKYIAVVLALLLVLLFTSTVSAKNETIEFTYTEVCDNDNMIVDRWIFNGQVNWLMKGFHVTCTDTASIPQYTGTLVAEGNSQQVGTNGIWVLTGKARLETEEGGVWNMNCVFPTPLWEINCQGQGEGKYAGMQIFIREGFGTILVHGQ